MIFSTRRSFSRRLALPTVRPLPSTATDARRAGTAARVLALIGIASLAGLLAPSASIAQAPPKTDDEKAFYSIGSGMADQFKDLKPISERELELLLQGVRDGIQGNTLAVERQQGGQLIRAMVGERRKRAIELEKQASAAFVAAEAAKSGAVRTESGLIYTELTAGTGASPSTTDKVRVHYHGTLRDGTVFDSSVERGEPAEFPLNRVIACWTEGVARMQVGGKSRLICPAEIAYGDRSTGRIPAGATLIFEVELLEIVN
jgi:FKBP-type peptidyl-prolyl cis-trans isomerase